MDTSLAHENARLRALLQTQQDTIRQMAEYNRLLSQRVAAYASEINRLKALVAKLQRMQFGKSSEKLRAKTERQIQEAQLLSPIWVVAHVLHSCEFYGYF